MGIGDAIMATAEARRLRKKYPNAKIAVGDGKRVHWNEVFNNNPNITRPEDLHPGDQVAWVMNYVGNRPYIDYERTTPTKLVYKRDFSPERGDLFIPADAKKWAEKALDGVGEFCIVEPNTKGTFAGNKSWHWVKWQSLVDLPGFVQKYNPVQIGGYGKDTLSDVKRIFTPEFKLALAVLARAKFLVTTDGALHHAAAALNIPAVVIWGARTNPKVLGYPGHVNIYNGEDESCGAITECAHCHEGMMKISPETVLKAIESICA